MFGFTTLASVSLLLSSVSGKYAIWCSIPQLIEISRLKYLSPAPQNSSLASSPRPKSSVTPSPKSLSPSAAAAHATYCRRICVYVARSRNLQRSIKLNDFELQTFTFISTLCSSVVLTQAKFCYDCLASSGSSVQALQKQADCTCPSPLWWTTVNVTLC